MEGRVSERSRVAESRGCRSSHDNKTETIHLNRRVTARTSSFVRAQANRIRCRTRTASRLTQERWKLQVCRDARVDSGNDAVAGRLVARSLSLRDLSRYEISLVARLVAREVLRCASRGRYSHIIFILSLIPRLFRARVSSANGSRVARRASVFSFD